VVALSELEERNDKRSVQKIEPIAFRPNRAVIASRWRGSDNANVIEAMVALVAE
jgi:hypothetical protein